MNHLRLLEVFVATGLAVVVFTATGPRAVVHAGPAEVVTVDAAEGNVAAVPLDTDAMLCAGSPFGPWAPCPSPLALAIGDTYATPTLVGDARIVLSGADVVINLLEQSRATVASGLRGTPHEFIRGVTQTQRPASGIKASLDAGACILSSWRDTYGFAAYAGLSPCG